MLFVTLAFLIGATCVGVSLARLRMAAAPTSLDLPALAEASRRGRGAVQRALLAQPEASWERSLGEALAAPPRFRVAALNECLMELDFATSRWSRVPRVTASIASTSAFLLAAMALRAALESASALEDEARGAALDAAIFRAVDVVALGLAAAAACIAVQMRAGRLARRVTEGADSLVERLGSDGGATNEAAEAREASSK